MPKMNEETRRAAMDRTTEVRLLLTRYNIRYFQLAEKVGISYNRLYHWMRNGLTEDHYKKIAAALQSMIGGEANA